jgi:Fur family transcriptional regulator, ferric uptake regulator
MTRRPGLSGVVQKIEDAGYRVTAPRLKVLAEIADAGDQFSAEEVASRLRGVGRATVFRTFKLLVDLGVLCRVLMDDGVLRYRWSRRGHHHHLVCAECGAVEDFTVCDVTELVRELTRLNNFTVEGHWLEVYGRCARCTNRAAEVATATG